MVNHCADAIFIFRFTLVSVFMVMMFVLMFFMMVVMMMFVFFVIIVVVVIIVVIVVSIVFFESATPTCRGVDTCEIETASG